MINCDRAVRSKKNGEWQAKFFLDGKIIRRDTGINDFSQYILPSGIDWETEKREPTPSELMDAILELAAEREG